MATKPEIHAQAVSAIENFWGYTNGGNAEYAKLQEKLESLRLDETELVRLRNGLPISEAQGTTAAKIARARQCIDEVIAG